MSSNLPSDSITVLQSQLLQSFLLWFSNQQLFVDILIQFGDHMLLSRAVSAETAGVRVRKQKQRRVIICSLNNGDASDDIRQGWAPCVWGASYCTQQRK